MKSFCIIFLLACVPFGARAQTSAPESATAAPTRLVLIGDIDEARIAQRDYCGKRTSLQADEKKAYRIAGDVPTWLKIVSVVHVPVGKFTCRHEWEFQPQAGQTYIARQIYDQEEKTCRVEIFQTVKGGDPIAVPVKSVDRAPSCLLR
jgi:hypothetical protein